WSVFQSISEEQPFYLIEDGIVVYFGLYEIAPYTSGIRYFKIPYSLFPIRALSRITARDSGLTEENKVTN
ncbi:unnamed protein product, partial [marine sediment metagenome]